MFEVKNTKLAGPLGEKVSEWRRKKEEKEAAGGLLSLFFHDQADWRGWLPQRSKAGRFTLSLVLVQRRTESLISFPLHSSVLSSSKHTLPAHNLVHSHHLSYLSLLFITFLELQLKLITSHSHHSHSISSPMSLTPPGDSGWYPFVCTSYLLFTFFTHLYRNHVLVRGVLELHWTPLGERIRGKLVSGETQGGWQWRGRRSAPLPHRRLAGPSLLLPHHAGRTGW